MKIRTDFVTNSSSSSYVTYSLTNSDFCKYLYEQMEKKGLSYDDSLDYFRGSESSFYLDDRNLEANLACCYEALYCDKTAPENWEEDVEYTLEEQKADVYEMSIVFLDKLAEILPLEEVDDLDKLYDAFVNDLENGRFECEVYMGRLD